MFQLDKVSFNFPFLYSTEPFCLERDGICYSCIQSKSYAGSEDSPPLKIEMKGYCTEPQILRQYGNTILPSKSPKKPARPKCRLWEGKMALHPKEGTAKDVQESGCDGQDRCQDL